MSQRRDVRSRYLWPARARTGAHIEDVLEPIRIEIEQRTDSAGGQDTNAVRNAQGVR